MAYRMYLGTMLCPVTPSKIDVKIKGQNKTLTLINDSVVNVLKNPGLTEITFDLLLPNVKYPFAEYNIVWKNAQWYLNRLEMLKKRKKVFQYILTRTFPNGTPLYDTNMSVSLENYTIKEDAKQGLDVIVSVTLKQYVKYGTKIVNVSTSDGTASVEETRETENSPAPSENSVKTHTVTGDDTLWNIAKMYYGDGSKYTLIYDANKDKIANPSVIWEGQVLTIPGATNTVASSESPSSVPKSVKKTEKKMVTILFDGIADYYGDFLLSYTQDGKIYHNKKFVNEITVPVDKGTDVLLIPQKVNDESAYSFYIEEAYSGKWERERYYVKATQVEDNIRICLYWCNRYWGNKYMDGWY